MHVSSTLGYHLASSQYLACLQLFVFHPLEKKQFHHYILVHAAQTLMILIQLLHHPGLLFCVFKCFLIFISGYPHYYRMYLYTSLDIPISISVEKYFFFDSLFKVSQTNTAARHFSWVAQVVQKRHSSPVFRLTIRERIHPVCVEAHGDGIHLCFSLGLFKFSPLLS